MERVLTDLVDEWTETYTSISSQTGLGRDLRFWMDWCSSRSIDPLQASSRDVTRYRNWLATPVHTIRLRTECYYKPASIQRRLSSIRSFYAFLIAHGETTVNPVEGVRSPRGSQVSQTIGLSKDEAMALLRAADDTGPFQAAVFWALIVTGLRISELVNVDLSDLHDRGAGMFFAVRVKGGHHDHVRVHEPAACRVRELIEHRAPTGSRALFVHRGLRVRDHQVQEMLHKLTRSNGLPPVTPHGLRHTCATLMLDSGASLADVQMQLRHARLESTLRYDRSRKSRASEANERFAALLGGS